MISFSSQLLVKAPSRRNPRVKAANNAHAISVFDAVLTLFTIGFKRGYRSWSSRRGRLSVEWQTEDEAQ